MFKLTNAQSEAINNSPYTHDYHNEAIRKHKKEKVAGCDLIEMFTERFEKSIKGKYKKVDDIGGITLYYTGKTLNAWYDYENFRGAFFE